MSTENTVLVAGIDYYIENGRWVFTSAYHLKRGHCCKTACRHCPFGNSPSDRASAANGGLRAMNVESLTPMLRTWDIAATIEFYSRMLGFTCDSGGAESGCASLRRGAVSLMLSGPNSHEGDTSPSFTGSLYFRVRDVDSLWLQLQDKVRICYPLEDFEYGMREFAIYDNNGYLLQFGQAIDE